MEFKSLEIIKDLEKQIQTGYSLSIFKGYVAINKRGVEKLIDELYANLPDDVVAARTYLKNSKLIPINHLKFLITSKNLKHKLKDLYKLQRMSLSTLKR